MSIIKINFKNNSLMVDLPERMLKKSLKENIGNTKDDFIPLNSIGEGGFGIVLKVKSKKNNNIYAMKIINKEKIRIKIEKMIRENNLDEEISEEKYSKKEILVLKKLNHPNIVKIYGDFMDEDNYYIILEYIEGRDLSQFCLAYLQEEKLIEEKLLWDFLGQCLDALVYFHGKGVIHRDLKPTNILIDEKTMNLKIIDFNTSAVMDLAAAQDFVDKNNKEDKLNLINKGTEINNIFGAPEIGKEDGSVYDARIDVFSIGNIFLKMLSPFDEGNNIYYYSKELIELIQKMILPEESRPTSNEIYNLYKKYYSNKYIKYSSIFSCFHCLYNYPIWLKEKNNQIKKFKKNEISNYFFEYLFIFHKNYQAFENNIKEFKINQLPLIYENNDKCQEIDPLIFIKYILAKLNEELNTIKENSVEFKYVVRDLLKEEKYLNYKKKYKSNISSIISNNFFGLLEMKKTCEKCKKNDYFFNYFSFLCFNIETLIEKNVELKPDQLFDILETDFEREIICNNCKILTNHIENIRFFNVPKNLIIYFDRKKKNSKEKIKIDKIIDFPEILTLSKMHVEILLSDKYPDEIKYYLSSVLCQMDDDEGNEFYISFTRDFSLNQNNNKSINNKFYNFSEIKGKYQIIGLFYLSDDKEVINNYVEGERIYKLNISNQNLNYINKFNINNNNGERINLINNNIMNNTNKNQIFINKDNNLNQSNLLKNASVNDKIINKGNSNNYLNFDFKGNNKNSSNVKNNKSSSTNNNISNININSNTNTNKIYYTNNDSNNTINQLKNVYNNNINNINFFKADKNLIFNNNYEGNKGGFNNNSNPYNPPYINNFNPNYNYNNPYDFYNMQNNFYPNAPNPNNSKNINNYYNNQSNNIFNNY